MAKRRRRIDAKGRSTAEAKHVRLYRWELESPAYRSLSCYSRALLIELKMAYDGENNGRIGMSVRRAADRLGCNVRTAMKALGELEDRGFIVRRTPGSFDWKTRHATEWLLTEYPFGDALPTKDFMSWRTAPEIQKPVARRTTVGGTTYNREPEGKAGNSPDGCITYNREPSKATSDGCTTYNVYSLPCDTASGREAPPSDSSVSGSAAQQIDLEEAVAARSAGQNHTLVPANDGFRAPWEDQAQLQGILCQPISKRTAFPNITIRMRAADITARQLADRAGLQPVIIESIVGGRATPSPTQARHIDLALKEAGA